jgi:hypothetical protein
MFSLADPGIPATRTLTATGSLAPGSRAHTNASVGSEVIAHRTSGLADTGGQER